MHRCFAALAAAFALTLITTRDSSAADDEKLKEYRAMLKEVSAKLVARCYGDLAPPAGYHWPPDIDISPSAEIDAHADAVMKNGKLQPVIRVSAGMMEKVIEDDPPRLALVVGHELGHILLKHVPVKGEPTPFLTATFSREHEHAADDVGMKLILRTEYKLQDAIGAMTRMHEVMKELKRPSTAFDGFTDHPPWPERLARLDKSRATLWKSMTAFDDGVVFLTAQDYYQAEGCFAAVVAEFPKCHEAQTNLGYARLMRYCDLLEDKDIRKLDLGQLVTGGFYTRADPRPRGQDRTLWLKAEAALLAADDAKADQPMVLANLGLAYLLHPDGKDMKRATHYFDRAATAAEAEVKRNKNFDPLVHAQLTLNHGIKDIAEGKTKEGLARFDRAAELARTVARVGPNPGPTSPEIESSLLHARATVLARSTDKSEREKSLPLFEAYLRAVNPKSLWWKPTFERYTELAAALGKPALGEAELNRGQVAARRPTLALPLKSGKRIALNVTADDLTKLLGPGIQTSAVPGRDLRRIEYAAESFAVLVSGGDSGRVLAIILQGSNAPPIPITESGTGGKEAGTLKIDMPMKEVEKLLGTADGRCRLVSTQDKYQHYFREQGIAIREVDDKVAELVIVQVP